MGTSEGGSSGEESDIDSKNQDIDLDDFDVPEKKQKPGIIYLSSVPEGMNVAGTTNFFAEFGRVGRILLVPAKTFKWSHKFVEGWVEFLSKKTARRVAEQINGKEVVTAKKKNKQFGEIWNIKYLPRFKWVHLSEQLNYEKARKMQKMRTETEQEKKNVDHFKSTLSVKKKRKLDAAEKEDGPPKKRPFVFKQVEVKRREEGEPRESSTTTKPKSKKTKKGHKSKDKDVSPKLKTTPSKSTKSKKESRKSGSKTPIGKGSSAKKSGSRTPKKSPVPSSSMRRRSADSFQAASSATAGEGGGGSRNSFLKSVFGGGTS